MPSTSPQNIPFSAPLAGQRIDALLREEHQSTRQRSRDSARLLLTSGAIWDSGDTKVTLM